MVKYTNYIATWFYKESKDEASFYPQMGEKGSSALVHSIYLQIQVPFFITFKHYNPEAQFLFFTNLKKEELPDFLISLFTELQVRIITLPYTCRPPKGWYSSWQNQFYLYDIFKWTTNLLQDYDTLLVCDADCLCHSSLTQLFEHTHAQGSSLYEFITEPTQSIHGTTLSQMESFYEQLYQQKVQSPLSYYGGEFIALRGDKVRLINQEFPLLWKFNLAQKDNRLNEEAQVISILAERLKIRNNHANLFVKRMWTSPKFNNIEPQDIHFPVWHLPYEKKRGLYLLFRYLQKKKIAIENPDFWRTVQKITGIPTITLSKRVTDFIISLKIKFLHNL